MKGPEFDKDPTSAILILFGVIAAIALLLAVAAILFGGALSGCTRLPNPASSALPRSSCCSQSWPGSQSVAVYSNVRGTAYYPDASPLEGGFNDRKGHPLKTINQYLAGDTDAVTVAMDATVAPYGTRLCSPEINASHTLPIPLELKDTGGAFIGRSWTRIDFCVTNYSESIRSIYNRSVTIEVCQ